MVLGASAYICGERNALWNLWKVKANLDLNRLSANFEVFMERSQPQLTIPNHFLLLPLIMTKELVLGIRKTK
jgi:hypothetical protein